MPVGPPRYEFSWDYACPGASPDAPPGRPVCQSAILACSSRGDEAGPLMITFRRQTYPVLSEWLQVGTSCNPRSAPTAGAPADPAAPPAAAPAQPGAPARPAPPPRPVLTIGMILDAVRKTPFTAPKVVAQPVGGATLVRLPVYLQLTWPEQGYQPDEVAAVDPATMLGYTVKIKPVLQSATYDFGDGTVIGPTQDLGGPYPTGRITHPYRKAGTFRTKIDATYRAEVSVNGGPFTPIGGTTTMTSPLQPIVVKSATNELVR